MTTKGEYRVGVSFNPSQNPEVDIIKALTAKLIDAVEAIDDTNNPEIIRLKSLAQTHYEDAAMWAVKAATKDRAVPVFGQPSREAINLNRDDPYQAAVRATVTKVYGDWETSYSMVPPDNSEMMCMREMERQGFRATTPADFIETWRAMLTAEGHMKGRAGA